MLSSKQRAVVRDAQMKKWTGFGEVKIPAAVVSDYADSVFDLYVAATFPNGSLESPKGVSAMATLCDEAEIECEADETPSDRLRLLIAAWRTRWVKERSTDDDEERPQRIIRYWLDAIERIDWDAIGNAAVGSNLGRPENFAALAAGQWTLNKDATLLEDTPAMLIAYAGKRALLAVPIIAKKDGQIGVPDENEPLLLNPDFFPSNEAEVSEWTVAMRDEIPMHLPDAYASWPTRWSQIVEKFAAASIDLQAVTTLSRRDYAMNVKWCISDSADVSATVAWIVRAYRQLLSEKGLPRLFERILNLEEAVPARRSLPIGPGHVDEFDQCIQSRRVKSMDPSQRTAASYAASLDEDEALVVNGPPGTGKTTLLRGVIATKWLEPLLSDLESPKPPIIVGTGATNIAVQNILGAFDAAPAPPSEKPTRFDERWIPGIGSYGWFFPSATKAKETDRQSLRERGGCLQYLNTSQPLLTISAPGGGPQRKTLLATIESAYLEAAATAFGQTFETCAAVVEHIRALLRNLDRTRRRGLNTLADTVFKAAEGGADNAAWSKISKAFIDFVDADIPDTWQHLRDSTATGEKRNEVWKAIQDRISGALRDDGLLHALGAYSETAYSPLLFHFCARAWEGLWLAAQDERDPVRWQDIRSELRIAAMLGPCIVSTFHTLPSIAKDEDGLRFRLFDLLIIDEAGQASAEIAAASVAFAKRLLVVGDAEQLQPIPRVEEGEDRDLLAKAELVDLDQALALSSGSALRIAKHLTVLQLACPLQDRGATLLYHYRCHDDIIEFCNQLRYGGRLFPRAKKPEKSPPWPAMSYVLTDGHFGGAQGVAENKEGWSNRQEAIEIAEWLSEQRGTLELHYGLPLAEIVAVVTPFVGQEAVLIKILRDALGYADNKLGGMIVGTVSKLQGAEKAIVLFSSVVTPDKQSGWLDENEHLINVAASRAKDSFVCFAAHATLFKPEAATALSKLGAYLGTPAGQLLYPNEVVVVEAPGKVKKIAEALGRRRLVIATGGHFRDLPEFDQPEPDWSAIRWVEKNTVGIDAIAKAIRELPCLILATDDDREGEAIAWHVLDALAQRGIMLRREAVLRMRFSRLSNDALQEAHGSASVGIDLGRVRAAITRNILDHLIGRRYAAALGSEQAVGRVQSALLLDAERRERARSRKRTRFARATIADAQGTTVDGWIVDDDTSRGERQVVAGERNREWDSPEDLEVTDLGERSVLRSIQPPKPPGTADVLVAAYKHLKMAPAQTMLILEQLYLGKK